MALAKWRCEEVPVSGAERIEATMPCLLVIQGFLLLLLFVYKVYFKIYKYVLYVFLYAYIHVLYIVVTNIHVYINV